eukprot:scaffold35521_cov112-Isochrysis_galbana.AAC.3
MGRVRCATHLIGGSGTRTSGRIGTGTGRSLARWRGESLPTYHLPSATCHSICKLLLIGGLATGGDWDTGTLGLEEERPPPAGVVARARVVCRATCDDAAPTPSYSQHSGAHESMRAARQVLVHSS